METIVQTPVSQSVTSETQAAPGKTPGSKAIRGAMAKAYAESQAELASLQARIVKLEANQKTELPKAPVSDELLAKTIAQLQGINSASLATASPKLDLSLAARLGFRPDFTATQKPVWAKARDDMRKAFSAAWKDKSGIVIAHLRRAARNPVALMGGGIKTRKTDNAVTAVSLRANKLAKPLKVKGKGKGAAKPSQIAASMPAAPNANPPATVK